MNAEPAPAPPGLLHVVVNGTPAELQARSDSSYVSAFDIATIYAGLRDRTKTFEYLEKAYQERVPYLVFLAVDPHFDEFRSDPRFRDLVHRIGLPAGS